MKLTKGKLIAAGVICGALVITYVAGGGYAVKDSTPLSATNSVTNSAVNAVSSKEDALTATGGAVAENTEDSQAKDGGVKSSADNQEKGTMTAEQKVAMAQSMGSDASSAGVKKGSSDYSQSKGMNLDPETGKDKYLTEPVPEGKPVPVEPQDTVISNKKLTCTLSVRCDTILNNLSALDPEKVELVPTNGAILATATVTFYEGESVFNVLQREMKKNKIHMEFVNTPLYNSAYIEGINNLYEFDCGELSGWMYKVNDWFPNYGCSRYQLKQGDVIEWVYTCDLGRDVGGYYSTGADGDGK